MTKHWAALTARSAGAADSNRQVLRPCRRLRLVPLRRPPAAYSDAASASRLARLIAAEHCDRRRIFRADWRSRCIVIGAHATAWTDQSVDSESNAMDYGLYVSAAGADTQSRRMEVLSHNMANVDTCGFKEELAVLQARYSRAKCATAWTWPGPRRHQ